jgi:hypothetical protein
MISILMRRLYRLSYFAAVCVLGLCALRSMSPALFAAQVALWPRSWSASGGGESEKIKETIK